MTIERLNLAALIAMLALIAAAAAAHPAPASVAVELWFGLLIALTMAVGRGASGGRVWYGLTVATAAVVSTYAALASVIAALGAPPRDRVILAAEAFATRGHWPPLLLLPLPAWLFDGFSIAYLLYFGLPAMLIVALVRRGQPDEARAAMFTILVAFYLHYALYLVVPAVGPLRTPDVNPLLQARFVGQGGWMTHAVRSLVSGLEGATPDAFPSAHTSISLLVAVLAIRHRLRGRWLVCGTAAAIALSTIVLGYHYAADLVFALPMAALAWRVSRRRLDPAFAAHLQSPPWRSSITSTSA